MLIFSRYVYLAFEKEIAPSRTFVFFHELEYLLKHNLIKGGDLQNAIVIMENEVSQDELDRMADLFNKPHVKVKEGILNNVDSKLKQEYIAKIEENQKTLYHWFSSAPKNPAHNNKRIRAVRLG